MSLKVSYNVLKSSFRRGHSTEIALLQIHNNIYSTASNLCKLVLLDLLFALYSPHRNTLLTRLNMICLMVQT